MQSYFVPLLGNKPDVSFIFKMGAWSVRLRASVLQVHIYLGRTLQRARTLGEDKLI